MATPFSTAGSIVVVTGGAGGIGRALAERFLGDGAAAVVLADRDADRVARAAQELGDRAYGRVLDVSDGDAVAGAIPRIEDEFGAVDLWCSNAGVALGDGLGEDADWETSWRVHVLAHVHVARELLPRMARRGGGHLLITSSAAGLLTQLDSAPYTVTKHGAVALAEWLAIRHAREGIGVSCLCPQGVRTAMTAGDGTSATRAAGEFLEPRDVAEEVSVALSEGRFLILPHPEVAGYEQRRAADRERWLGGMGRAWERILEQRDAATRH